MHYTKQLVFSSILALTLGAAVTLPAPALAAATDPSSYHEELAVEEMFRLYNPYTGEHFYTASAEERDTIVAVGWRYEGVGWLAPTESSTPVYRLYNRYVKGGDHHYTTDRDEYEHLVDVGWSGEGVKWYSDDEGAVPILRQYNPYATTGTHNFTRDVDEHNNLLSVGWSGEGVAWHGTYRRSPIECEDIYETVTVVDKEAWTEVVGTHTEQREVPVEKSRQEWVDEETQYTLNVRFRGYVGNSYLIKNGSYTAWSEEDARAMARRDNRELYDPDGNPIPGVLETWSTKLIPGYWKTITWTEYEVEEYEVEDVVEHPAETHEEERLTSAIYTCTDGNSYSDPAAAIEHQRELDRQSALTM